MASLTFHGTDELAELLEHQEQLERRVLRAAGWFPWGHRAWIHRNAEGTVVEQSDAVDRVLGHGN